jgi:phage terminase small subunit
MRKTRIDSTTGITDSFRNAGLQIQPPEGIDLKDDELVIWSQFTKARAADAWRDFDLVLLAKSVKLEANIRKYQIVLDEHGPIIENQRGTPIENPMLRAIDTLQRQQLAIIRSMSLNQTPQDPRTLNTSAKEEKKAHDMLKKHGAESLLAMPVSH